MGQFSTKFDSIHNIQVNVISIGSVVGLKFTMFFVKYDDGLQSKLEPGSGPEVLVRNCVTIKVIKS